MMKWLDDPFCQRALLVAGMILGIVVGIPLGEKLAIDRMEKEAVFRQAGFYGKDGDKLKFYWGPKWIEKEARDE